jgi:hypothetical protein
MTREEKLAEITKQRKEQVDQINALVKKGSSVGAACKYVDMEPGQFHAWRRRLYPAAKTSRGPYRKLRKKTVGGISVTTLPTPPENGWPSVKTGPGKLMVIMGSPHEVLEATRSLQ